MNMMMMKCLKYSIWTKHLNYPSEKNDQTVPATRLNVSNPWGSPADLNTKIHKLDLMETPIKPLYICIYIIKSTREKFPEHMACMTITNDVNVSGDRWTRTWPPIKMLPHELRAWTHRTTPLALLALCRTLININNKWLTGRAMCTLTSISRRQCSPIIDWRRRCVWLYYK